MSTSKHIDKICIATIIITLILTFLFMSGSSLGLTQKKNVLGYEDKLFNKDIVHEINIVMDDFSEFIENCESEEYYNCNVIIDGEKYTNIAIRAKGNTSLSSVKSMGSQRYSFKLEFDHYDDSKNYHGLDKLCLNNLIQDNTMMKDYLVYQMMNEFGVYSPLCSYAYISVNGEEWGLYLALEGVEDSFLERNFGSQKGELYKPDSMNFGGGRGNGKDFDMADFNNQQNDNEQFKPSDNRPPNEGFNFENMPQKPGDIQEGFNGNFDFGDMPQGKEENFGFGGMGSDDVKLKYIDDDIDSYNNIFDNAKTTVSNSDKKRLINSLKNLSEYKNLDETLDKEEVLRYFVVHNFVVNGDSYTGSMVHNYYLHENDGKLSMIPWDYNLAFGTFQGGDASSSINQSIDNPMGSVDDRPMFGWIFADEEYTKQYHDLFASFIEEWIEKGKLEQLIENTNNLISSYVEKDPTKFCTNEEFEKGVSALSKFVSLRGQAATRQLNGDNTKIQTTGLNISDMGTMNMGRDNGARNDFSPLEIPNFKQEFDASFVNEGEFPFSKDDRPMQKDVRFENTSVIQYLLVIISVIVLIGGIIIVRKKKY